MVTNSLTTPKVVNKETESLIDFKVKFKGAYMSYEVKAVHVADACEKAIALHKLCQPYCTIRDILAVNELEYYRRLIKI